jgi:hypothetical protein
MVEQMGWVFQRPLLTVLEVVWRWAFGIPLLWLCWMQWQGIARAYPLEGSGFTSLDTQNPWLAVVQLASIWSYYQPHVFAVLQWFMPVAALAWALIAGVGRNLVLRRMQPELAFRPVSMIVLHLAWLALLGAFFWLWFATMQWTAAAHISANAEPDLVGFAIWTIFLSLAFFSLWALVSWSLSIAPLLLLLENRSVTSSLIESLRLGKPFTGKLIEINLVMGIVKLALIVLAMVFSAAPLPFINELGAGALHAATFASAIFYLVASDYFHVVRLKGFIGFWQVFRSCCTSE